MIGRRTFLGLASALVLVGCETAPLLEVDARDVYSVRQVTVDTAAFTGVTGRVNAFSREQVARDIRSSLTSRLRNGSRGTRPVDVNVQLTKVHLVSPGQSLLIGGTSNISGVMRVKDAATGKAVLEPINVHGTAKGTYAPGGVIGALSTRSVDKDYAATISGFSSDVERRLFGSASTAKPAAKPAATTSAGSEAKDLETRVREARRAAELEARRRHSGPCISVRCEVDIQQSAKEAEERVRREAALASN